MELTTPPVTKIYLAFFEGEVSVDMAIKYGPHRMAAARAVVYHSGYNRAELVCEERKWK
jgi:hypothetical protein